MKRIIVLFMMLILSIVLVGCSKESEKEKDDSELTEQEKIDKQYMIKVFGKDYQSVMDEKLGKILNQVKAVEL